MTSSDVLEMGIGIYSTPYLHSACLDKRRLVSYENNPQYYKYFKSYSSPLHQIHLVDNWDKADIEKPWDIALIDHSPESRRKEDIKRLAGFAKYLVVHDSEPQHEDLYGYSQIFRLFKYRYDFVNPRANTSVLSNLVDLHNLKI